jgi:nucleotide-binding universal stress UspA family protein
MKILLAVDGSLATKRMLSHLAAHEELLGGGHQYTVLTVVPPLPLHAGRFVDRDALQACYREEAEQVFRPIRAFVAQQGWQASFETRVGHAAETIATMAREERFELLVMGTHGHSALANTVLGSVVTGALARCRTPMLLVH